MGSSRASSTSSSIGSASPNGVLNGFLGSSALATRLWRL